VSDWNCRPSGNSDPITRLAEFAYSGDIEDLDMSDSERESVALENLLDLLKLADCWDLPDLLSLVTRKMDAYKLVRLETCESSMSIVTFRPRFSLTFIGSSSRSGYRMQC
jgi:hypothetical protein